MIISYIIRMTYNNAIVFGLTGHKTCRRMLKPNTCILNIVYILLGINIQLCQSMS